MTGIGTIINAALIVVGTAAGILLKGGIKDRFREIVFSAIGVAVIFIGITGVVKNQGDSLMMVLSMVIGGLIGELLSIEERLERLGDRIKARFVKPGDSSNTTFAEGFVSASILFVVGAMAIVGSLNDGLLHDPSVLITKGIIDGITSLILAASFGIGVGFSALPVLVYQGLITVLASVLAPLLTDTLIMNMAFVGNALIFCIGMNFLLPKKIKVGNLFPAMFMPILLGFVIR